jgi:hypothetical protein
MQFFTDITHRLMVAKTSGIEIPPPKILIELGVIRVQKLEVMR